MARTAELKIANDKTVTETAVIKDCKTCCGFKQMHD